MRVLVMGCGGIGGIVSGHLAEVGVDVTPVTTNEAISRAVRSEGFRLRGDGDDRDVPGRIELGLPEGAEPFDLVLLATQPPQVEQAARSALPHLADGGHMVVFQNGLCELRIAEICGAERTLGAVITWGASMPEPGLYDRTAQGAFTLGTIAGPPTVAVNEIGRLLEAVAPVTITSNLMGARWSKMAINCAISSLPTVAGERLGPLIVVRRYRRLVLEVMTEVVQVARAEGIALEKAAGTLDLDWIAMTDAERASRTGTPTLATKHALLVAVGMRYRRLRSSMLSAIERGRPPAIDFLNGEVVARGRHHGIPTPINERAIELVRALAAGKHPPGRQHLDALYRETR